ncbi:MAG: ABC transporter substrate-binding protein [Alphaproteobacteria bacterium]|nr:ABC transporter substrate-binding protein [Alphaproteobacteria bacterium]
MKINHFLQLISLFLCLLWSSLATASPLTAAEAQKWANEKGQEIIRILTSPDSEEKTAKLDEIATNDIDLAHAARFVMGKYWKQMNDEQKERYLAVFNDYVRISYQSLDLTLKEGSVRFTIDKAVQNGDKVDVFCTVFIKDIETNVTKDASGGIKAVFVVVKNNDRIQVRDLKIEESSLLIAYRQRFYKMIHEDSDDEIDWFLDDLETIVQDNTVSDE